MNKGRRWNDNLWTDKFGGQTSPEGQSAGSGTAPIPSSPTGQATGQSTPGTAGEQTVAQVAGPASTSPPAAASDGGESGSAFLGWWYPADPPKLIPNGTPAVFYIGRHGDQFVVEMHSSMGDNDTTTSCGSQYVPLTNNALSMVWDEPAIPGCHYNGNAYAANVRLYMVGKQLHMPLSGRYPSTDLVFKHEG